MRKEDEDQDEDEDGDEEERSRSQRKPNNLHNDGGEICLALLVVSEVPEL